MALFRGMDGSATIAAATVAQISEWDADIDLEVMPAPVMGDKWRAVKGGMAGGTGRIRCLLDYVTGQKDLIDKLLVATPVSTSAALVLIVTSTGPKQISGNALLHHVRFGQPVGGYVEVEFQFTFDGAVSISWT